MCLTQPGGWKRINTAAVELVGKNWQCPEFISLALRTQPSPGNVKQTDESDKWHVVDTYSERFRKPGAEVVEDYGDDVLVGDVDEARLEVHLPGSHQIQGILKRHL